MEQTDGEILLEMNHVKKSFDGNGVLEDISLTVKKGEVVSIIGPSGSGKSTLLRCATLLEKMDGGERGIRDQLCSIFCGNLPCGDRIYSGGTV